MEVEVEGDDTCVGQPPTVPTCCISVMDKFLCSQQISDMSPFKKHQVRKRSWQFLREPVHVVHALFNLRHPAHRMGLSTFYKRMKRVPWVKTSTKATLLQTGRGHQTSRPAMATMIENGTTSESRYLA